MIFTSSLMIGCQEGHPAYKTCAIYREGFFQNNTGKNNGGDRLFQGHLEKDVKAEATMLVKGLLSRRVAKF